MSNKLNHTIVLVTITWIALFVVLTVITPYNPFPYSTCLAPWAWRSVSEDIGFSNETFCAIDIARRTGDLRYCDRLTPYGGRFYCITEVATFRKAPQICKEQLPDRDIQYCLIESQKIP